MHIKYLNVPARVASEWAKIVQTFDPMKCIFNLFVIDCDAYVKFECGNQCSVTNRHIFMFFGIAKQIIF